MKRIQKKATRHIPRGWRTTPADALDAVLYLKPELLLLQETAADPLIRMAAKEHCARIRMIAIANTMAKYESLLATHKAALYRRFGPHALDIEPTTVSIGEPRGYALLSR